MCGVGTDLCRAWSEKVCAALAEGRVGDVLAELRLHAGDKTVDEAIGDAPVHSAALEPSGHGVAGALHDARAHR